MVLRTYILLLSASLHLAFCHPANNQPNLPKVNISNPYEINNLNYYNGDVDSDPGESKLFRRTVSNFEKSVNYIDKTVKEVESLINSNSTLPRLTRGEILEIIENITKTDLEAAEKNKTKGRDQKAIMLVMPYTPQNTDDDKMQELFTRKPVTRIIGEIPKPSEAEVKPVHKRRRRPLPQMPDGAFYGEVFAAPLPVKTTEEPPQKKPEKKPVNSGDKISLAQKQRPPVFTQRPLISQSSTTAKPKIRFTYEPEIIRGKPFVEQLSTEKPKRRRGSTTQKPNQEASTQISINTNTQTNISIRKRRPSKTPQRHSNHKYPGESESTLSKEGLKIIESPNLGLNVNQNFNAKLPEFTTKKLEIFTYPTLSPLKPSKPHSFTTAKPPLSNVNLPDDLKSTLEDLELGDSVPKIPSKFNSQYDTDTENLPSPPPLKDNVKDILVSIGVFPSTTTTTSIPDISHVADTLTPDMKELLMSFGLLPDSNRKPEQFKEQSISDDLSAEVNPNSYVQFKPLPDNGPTRDDMEEFLGRFGLGRKTKSNRNQKAITAKKPEKVLTEVPDIEEGMVPDSMKDVLSDLGLTNRHGKKIRGGSTHKTLEKQNDNGDKSSETHVFNPMEPQYATDEEIEKLNQLLDIIKQLEKLNRTVTESDLNKVDLNNLKDLVGSFNKEEFVPLDEQDGAPNPVNYDYGLSKNEVKRQESSTPTVSLAIDVVAVSSPGTPLLTDAITTGTTASITVSSTTAAPSTTTTEEPRTPNIKDLEDSFGGSSDAEPLATLPPAPPPTQAPNTGFYYLLDWNTFLDIDDQKGKRVNLRFQPKAGDPQKFISVSVP